MNYWLLGIGAALAITTAALLPLRTATSAPEVVVYKSPTCGCCSAWIDHLQDNGFKVVARDTTDLTTIKEQHGVTPELASCHTAVVDGYVLEGHVPAADVKTLLAQRPAITGLAVPGMPIGSPGMEQGDTKQPYDVVAFDKQGVSVFSSYR
jgi:hypothetical protein